MLSRELDVCIQNNKSCGILRSPFKYFPKEYGDDERLVIGTDVTIEAREKMDLYIADIEQITNRKMHDEQKELIKEYVNTHKIYRVDLDEKARRRKQFNGMKKKLRREWELKTGEEWPRYKEDVIVNGKVWRTKGQFYDAHHIVEVSFGGPNVWYNLFPAASPYEHQYGIHDDFSVGTEIFGPIDRRFRKKKIDFRKLSVKKIEDPENEENKNKNKKKKKRRKSIVTKIRDNVIRIS